MSTADSSGRLTAAVYGKPHFLEEGSVAFIMADRLTHKNLESNPYAVYLFMESGDQYGGRRLYLKKIKEEKNSPMIDKIKNLKGYPAGEEYVQRDRFLVSFAIEKVLPLVGDSE
jgi:hypothetical protein